MIKGYENVRQGLEYDIISRINLIKRRRLLVKQGFYGLVSLFSFAGIIFSVDYIAKYISTSGIYGYIDLVLSDFQTLVYWKELSLSILESLPFLGFAVGFAVLGIFLWSTLKTFRIQSLMRSIA